MRKDDIRVGIRKEIKSGKENFVSIESYVENFVRVKKENFRINLVLGTNLNEDLHLLYLELKFKLGCAYFWWL